MTLTVRHIPFRRLGAAGLKQRFLEDDRDLVRFFGERARSVEELLRSAPTGAGRVLRRETLVEALEAYADKHGAPKEVHDAAQALLDGNVHLVVTGQQPGLCGGPLYTLHKAATAIRLCKEINALERGPRVVPLFWNHSDDHDLDEANRLFLVNQSQEVQRFRIDRDYSSEPLRSIAVGREVSRVLQEVDSLLPETEFRDWALSLFRPKHPDETLASLQTRLMYELFGKHGMLVIEPRDLPPEAFEPLPKWWGKAHEIRDEVKIACEDLVDFGFDVTLDPGGTMMFELSGGEREPLADGEAAARPHDLSPGVLLRPLWQDACLPTIAFVAGPGEFGYLAAAAPLYRKLGVPQPVLVPRASLTLVEPSLQRLMERFSLDITDLDRSPESLADAIETPVDGDLDEAVSELEAHFKTELEAMGQRLDKSMTGPLDRARTKVHDELERLRGKIRSAQQTREGTGLRQLRRLTSQLRPRGRMQERVLGPLPYLVSHGPSLIDTLIEVSDPFRIDHAVLEF